MNIKSNKNYLTYADWIRDVLTEENIILKGESAILYWGLFSTLFEETEIEVYSIEPLKYENVHYTLVDVLDKIDYVNDKGILCSSLSQAYNDILSNYDNADEQLLIESLSDYYHENDNSFTGLNIKDENLLIFNKIKEYAINFYNY